MPSLKNLFKLKGGGDTATIRELERQAADLVLELNDTELAANGAFLAAVSDPAANPAADAAAAEVREVRDRLHRVNGALQEAGQRKEDAVLLAEERAVAAAWKRTENLAKVRHDLAIKAETQILNLYETYVELIQVGQDLHAAAPVRGARKLHNSMLSPVQLTAAFRMFMLRSGFAWAYSTPWGIEKIPALSDRVKAGSDEIMEYRNTAREAA